MQKITNRIREILENEKGLSLETYANQIGIDRLQLQRIADGKEPNVRTAQKIASGLGKKLHDIWPIRK